jgi:crotonobetaine/carnitine-CoA ligase
MERAFLRMTRLHAGNGEGGTGTRADLAAIFPPGERTLPAMLARQAEIHGDRQLVVFGDETWSYADAASIAARSAGTLVAVHVSPGDRVALMCGNRPEFLRIYLGCAWLGAVVVPINTASRGAQLAHILATCAARLLIVEPELVPVVEGLRDASLAVDEVWVIDGSDGAAACAVIEDAGAAPWPYRALPELGEPAAAHAVLPADPSAILFTSGTTGLSKGVCCPHAQYFWWGYHSAELLGLREDDVLLTPLPLFHTNALNSFYQALLTGSTLVVESRFSASGFFPALARHRATVTYLLGAMVPMLLSKVQASEARVHRTRIALAPAAPAHLQQEFRDRFGIGLVDGYGSTETNFVIGSTLDEHRPGFMGKVRPGFEARVVDEHDNALPPGEPGELVLRASEPFAFSTGYFGMAEKTVEAWRNLWFHTGDRVVADADGYFRFLDRMKDAIRRRGENISCFEVEQVLVSHPKVENAAVFPVRSDLAEDEVMAAVVLRQHSTLSFAELLDYCQPRMPYFAVPRYLEFVTSLPMTNNGKVTKVELQERGVTDLTWDREKAGYQVVRNGAPRRAASIDEQALESRASATGGAANVSSR